MKLLSLRPLLCLLLTAIPALAVNRTINISAPAEAPAGGTVTVSVYAATDAADGEEIGFLHAEYSTDDGKTWTKFCYAQKAGAELARTASFLIGAKGQKTIVRMRVAFRGGKAGDVDFKGGAIQWDRTWELWRSPPAKFAVIYPTGR